MNRLRELSQKKVTEYLDRLKKQPGLFLETKHPDKENKTSFLFLKPRKILTYNFGDDLREFFARLEGYTSAGLWAAGYFSYEFGYLFEERLAPFLERRGRDLPLAWLGLFAKPRIIDHSRAGRRSKEPLASVNGFRLSGGRFNMDRSQYAKSLARIWMYLHEHSISSR